MRGMRDNYRRVQQLLTAIFVIPVIACIPLRSFAQSLLQSWSKEPQFSVEVNHPEFSGDNYKGLTNATYLSLRYPAGHNLLLDADLPFIYYKSIYYSGNNYYDLTRHTRSQFSPGNPYIGLSIYNPSSPMTVNFGVRLPLISKDDYNYPIIADYTSFYRFDSASQHVFTLSLKGHYFGNLSSYVSYQLYLGGIAAIYTKDGGDGQLLLPHGFALHYNKNEAILGGGISGIINISESHATVGERSMYHLYLEGGLDLKSWIPDLYLAFPIDKESSRVTNLIIGFRATIILNQIGK